MGLNNSKTSNIQKLNSITKPLLDKINKYNPTIEQTNTIKERLNFFIEKLRKNNQKIYIKTINNHLNFLTIISDNDKINIFIKLLEIDSFRNIEICYKFGKSLLARQRKPIIKRLNDSSALRNELENSKDLYCLTIFNTYISNILNEIDPENLNKSLINLSNELAWYVMNLSNKLNIIELQQNAIKLPKGEYITKDNAQNYLKSILGLLDGCESLILGLSNRMNIIEQQGSDIPAPMIYNLLKSILESEYSFLNEKNIAKLINEIDNTKQLSVVSSSLRGALATRQSIPLVIANVSKVIPGSPRP